MKRSNNRVAKLIVGSYTFIAVITFAMWIMLGIVSLMVIKDIPANVNVVFILMFAFLICMIAFAFVALQVIKIFSKQIEKENMGIKGDER